MLITKLLMAVLVITPVAAASAQSGGGKSPRALSELNSPDNRVADDPDLVKIEVASVGETPSNEAKEFKVGRKVRFDLIGTNVSVEAVTVFYMDTHYQDRPQLTKDGQEVPYRKGVKELVDSKDKELEMVSSPSRISLAPGETKKIGVLDLSEWYAPLEPGSYQMTNRHRFVLGGKWGDSSTVAFEVK